MKAALNSSWPQRVKGEIMVSITTQVSSSYVIVLQEDKDSTIRSYSRRVSRIATLDGGSVITDSGASDTDRILKIKATVTQTQADDLEYMIKTYALLNVATKNGVFSCAPASMKVDNGDLELILFVTE